MRVTPLLSLFPVLTTVSLGATIAQWDGGTNSAFTLNTFNLAPGPSVQATGGNPGGYLQLTAAANDQHNWATFDRTDPVANVVNFSFQFQLVVPVGGQGADGFSFSLLPTAVFGTTGGLASAPYTAEDPASAGLLGFGFDTWGNAGTFDANGNGGNYSEISLFWNNGLVSRIDDTRLLPVPLNLKDGLWHNVVGTINFQTTNVTMTVDGQPIFNNVAVPGLAPYESRVNFAARTGNANENQGIDNVNVEFVPEPASIGALAIGGLVLLRRRRRG